jgi:hypothetical protein
MRRITNIEKVSNGDVLLVTDSHNKRRYVYIECILVHLLPHGHGSIDSIWTWCDDKGYPKDIHESDNLGQWVFMSRAYKVYKLSKKEVEDFKLLKIAGSL